METTHHMLTKNDNVLLMHSYTDEVDPRSFQPHYHERCEFILFLSGDVSYIVEGKSYKLKKWDVVVSKPRQIHTILPEKGTKYDRYVAIINHHVLPKEIWDKIKNGPDVYSFAEDDRVVELFRKLDYYNGKFGDDIFASLAQAAITEVAYNLSLYDEESSLASVNPIILRALEYIKENLVTIESVEEICRVLYITKSHLHHLFTLHLQVTPAKYIMTKRLILAQRKIRGGTKPTQVFGECGFTDYATFFRNYRTHFGYPPSLEGKIQLSHEILT